jgi:hypothetical protein
MFRFTIRDVLWLTALAAVLVGWWLDRRQLSVNVADYQRLKAEESAAQNLVTRLMAEIHSSRVYPAPDAIEAEDATPMPMPGDEDYRFPPEYPLHYGPRRSP